MVQALFQQHRSWLRPASQPGGGYDAWKRFKFNRMPSDAAVGRVSDTGAPWGPCLPEEQYDIAQRLYVGDLINCDANQMQQRTCIVNLRPICWLFVGNEAKLFISITTTSYVTSDIIEFLHGRYITVETG